MEYSQIDFCSLCCVFLTTCSTENWFVLSRKRSLVVWLNILAGPLGKWHENILSISAQLSVILSSNNVHF